jgi:enoyl-CoA hydratase/carnithine racemase
VASVVLDRPERRNAQSPALWRELAKVPSVLPAAVRVVVLRADGPSFSAGLDRRMFTPEGVPGEPSLLDLSRLSAADLDAAIAGFQAAFRWFHDSSYVTVAAVQGHAVGAGFQLALACDLRLLASDAQFSMRETSLGLVPDLGGTKPLVEAVGYAKALEVCVTGRWIGADEAVSSGLALSAVAPDGLAAATAALVDSLLAAPRGAVEATKALLAGALDRSLDAQLAAERAAQVSRIAELARGIPPTA